MHFLFVRLFATSKGCDLKSHPRLRLGTSTESGELTQWYWGSLLTDKQQSNATICNYKVRKSAHKKNYYPDWESVNSQQVEKDFRTFLYKTIPRSFLAGAIYGYSSFRLSHSSASVVKVRRTMTRAAL